MKHQNTKVMIAATTLGLLGACQPSPTISNHLQPSPTISNHLQARLHTQVTTITAVQGQIQWPSSFSTQATVNDIQAQATVSLIYPSNHPTFANQTIATGLTTSTGAFIINPDSNFTPAADTVFVLEASKRVGGPGSDLLSLRTYLRWTGSTWTSITGPTIQINALTTAITIMDHYDNSFAPGDTIGSVSGGVPGSLGNNAGSAIASIRDLVTQALAEEQDPAHFIYHDGGSYQRRVGPFTLPSSEPTSEPSSTPTPPATLLINNAWRVNTYTQMQQWLDYSDARNSIAHDAQGNFVVAWTSEFQDGDEGGVYAQRFNALGEKVGNEFRVNETTLGDQQLTKVVMAYDGQFTVTWSGPGSQGNGAYFRRYGANGSSLGSEIKADDNLPYYYWSQSWSQHGDKLINTSYDYNIFNMTTKQQESVQVSTYELGSKSNYSHAINDQGLVLTAWEHTARDGSGAGIFAQRFDLEGNKLGGEFQVNTTTLYNQTLPRLLSLSNHGFVVLWNSQHADSSTRLMGQVLDSSGNKVGTEFEIATLPTLNSSPYYLADVQLIRTASGGFQVMSPVSYNRNYLYSLDGSYVITSDPYQIKATNFSATGQNLGSTETPMTFPSLFTNHTALGLMNEYYSPPRSPNDGTNTLIAPNTIINLHNYNTNNNTDIYLRRGTF